MGYVALGCREKEAARPVENINNDESSITLVVSPDT
jgi:hypothetical protein